MSKIHEAILFAAEIYKNSVEWMAHGTEVMQILASMGMPEDLQIAGLLHGAEKRAQENDMTPETMLELIGEMFGTAVTEMMSCSGTIDELETAGDETQILVMANAVGHLRSLAFEYKEEGEAMWDSVGLSKERESWYYSEVQDVLCDMQDEPETKALYWEMVNLYKDLFVTYHLDDEKSLIYQTACGLGGYVLSRKDPEWYEMEGDLPEGLEVLTRKEAERLEDLWHFSQEEVFRDETLDGNERIEAAIADFRREEDKETLERLAEAIGRRIEEKGHIIMPIEDGIEEGNIVPRTITTDDGEVVIPAFTSHQEMQVGPRSEMLSIRIQHLFEIAMELPEISGVILNPWNEFMYVGKDMIEIIEDAVELPEEEEEFGELLDMTDETTLLN